MKTIVLLLGLLLLTIGAYFFLSRAADPVVIFEENINYFIIEETNMPTVHPVDHASFVLNWGEEVIYNDPVGEADRYLVHGLPTMIVVTHSHPDHLDIELLTELMTDNNVPLIAPQEVVDKLGDTLKDRAIIMSNGDTKEVSGITLTAIPMYNITPERTRYHVKGVGNGYVYEKDGTRIYNASDTELTDEFKAQTGMDIAFIPMNDPYTMSFEMAVEAGLAIAPKQLYVYHYRGSEGLGDVAGFKSAIESANPNIEVILGEWY